VRPSRRYTGEPRTDLTGLEVGRLTVITWVPTVESLAHWLCQCSCGRRSIVKCDHLTRQTVKSCGCLRFEPPHNKTHGSSNSRLYRVWSEMKRRCYDPRRQGYENYGGRGIQMCPEWKAGFADFKDWAIAAGYRTGLTIDRIDVNGNYAPENCRWVTCKENVRNRRITRRVTVSGVEMSLGEAAEKYGVPYNRLKARLYMGYSPEDAVRPETDPLRRRSRGTSAMLAAATPETRAKGHALRWRKAGAQDIKEAVAPSLDAD
jgi:hypothetical protein